LIIRSLHRLGVPSDVFYLASLGSILGSIGVWARRNDKNAANAERLGIFVGLWAPTFMLIANGLQTVEKDGGLTSQSMAKVGSRMEDLADKARERASSVAR
jgi:hypothetical protein